MKMFWLGIALVIIGTYILSKSLYKLGYNAGFDDGKKAMSTVYHLDTIGAHDTIRFRNVVTDVFHPKADSILKANKTGTEKPQSYVGGRLLGKWLLVYDIKMHPDYLIDIETEETIKLKP